LAQAARLQQATARAYQAAHLRSPAFHPQAAVAVVELRQIQQLLEDLVAAEMAPVPALVQREIRQT
jgi:hypothetical protein